MPRMPFCDVYNLLSFSCFTKLPKNTHFYKLGYVDIVYLLKKFGIVDKI